MALAIKRPNGPATRHILASNGPSDYHLNFYSTVYSNNYHKKHHLHQPLTSYRHKGTGYQANFRPTVYYNKDVDRAQNPSIANLLTDNYNTLTSRDYVMPELKSGFEQLPVTSSHTPSGYTHNLPLTRQPLSQHLSSATSYRNSYPRKEFRSNSAQPSSNTLKEETGFTHACNIEPITFRPTESHVTSLPGHVTWRPTGQSVMKKDFTRTQPMTGNETLPILVTSAQRSNGFIKGNFNPAKVQPLDIKEPSVNELHPLIISSKSKKDPAMFSVATHPHPYTSYSSVTHPPLKLHPYDDKGNKTSIGKKEATGYVENTATKLPNTAPLETSTVCRECFHGNNLVTEPPPPSTVRVPYPDGFTKSTRVHYYGDMPSGEEVLRQQKPYVTRSKLSNDPCYVDFTHHHKLRQI